jgi:hypothetical protein
MWARSSEQASGRAGRLPWAYVAFTIPPRVATSVRREIGPLWSKSSQIGDVTQGDRNDHAAS